MALLDAMQQHAETAGGQIWRGTELIDEQEKSHHRWDKAPHSGVPHLIMMIYPAFILQATF